MIFIFISVCDQLDIILLLDASADMFQNNPNNPTVNRRSDNWSNMIDFMNDMLTRPTTSISGTRMGVITFGESANIVLRLGELTDNNEIAATLRGLRVSGLTLEENIPL